MVLTQNDMPDEGTIGGLILAGAGLSIHCNAQGRHHSKKFDLRRLAKRFGYRHGAMRDDLVPKFRCSKCGSKNLSLIRTPDYATPNEPSIAGHPTGNPLNLYARSKGT